MVKIAQDEAVRGRQPAPERIVRPDTLNRSHSSLVTDDSDVESPPALISRDSHSGYLTTTSPLIKTTTVDNDTSSHSPATYGHNASTEQFPTVIEPPSGTSSISASPTSMAVRNVPALPAIPMLVDKADMLRPTIDTSKRGKSPSRKFKEVFYKGSKSPKISPERADTDPGINGATGRKASIGFGERQMSENPDKRGPSPLHSQTLVAPVEPGPKSAPILQTEIPVPRTPPSAIRENPTTTVTPPTPTEHEPRASFAAFPSNDAARRTIADHSGNESQSFGNGVGHRRTRSASGASHQKSKLSTSMMPPLTPTIEEVRSSSPSVGTPGSRNVSAGGGFFSSWVSAAQNAATSIGNLTNQNRSRAGTGSTDQTRVKISDDVVREETGEKSVPADEAPKKELAVTTLGSGDLNLGHLGIDGAGIEQASSPARKDVMSLNLKDDATARMEDLLAKRAVSQAYEKPSKTGDATPIAEVPDPVASGRPTSTVDAGGALTPPNGSIYEGETNGVKRSTSVRSKLHNRRSRGSSVTTAQSALGAMVGASTATLTNPAAGGAKLSGFAIAPKPRNRAFHQQFRSVPEDDFLIEDYSCALQKEILLAGRLYISEGHICFSSNILGWVTTLIISFEEVVSVEKENTAIVIPNAIAVQTLHARHIFRSLLSREATYDLMIGIWRVSHPDSFQKSMNGKQQAANEANAQAAAGSGDQGDVQASDDDDSEDDSGSDDDDGSAPSMGSSGSIAGSEFLETNKGLSRNPSGNAGSSAPVVAAPVAAASGDATGSVAPIVAAADAPQDFPGPTTHAPTECSDTATHYDKIIKDEVIAAPLGKLYTLLFGPQSTAFMRKFLIDGVSKAQDLQLEEDKKGLDTETKSRQYKYIKPLGGSIGPKQTTCITTENLDSFDLEKSVSVTCTTQTPDVPSGSVFSTKTRYCLSWAPGNATRFQMNMTIEWTAKSWLKGPIEKGALDGQMQYGDDLVKTLKGALGRSRAATAGSRAIKGKKKRKSSKKDKSDVVLTESKREENWGPFEIIRPFLAPVVDPVKPFVRTNFVVTVLVIMVLWMWFRGASPRGGKGLSRLDRIEHVMVYEDVWRREESDLWEWLQERAGIDGSVLRSSLMNEDDKRKEEKQRLKERQKLLKSKDMQSRLREENKSMKEMEEAVRVTQERLDSLRKALEGQKNNGRG